MQDGNAGKNRYAQLIETIFAERYRSGMERIEFERIDIENAADRLGIALPKNIGDVIYSVRYRTSMPEYIAARQPAGMEWIIEGNGRSKYVFHLVKINRILPNSSLLSIKIPDSTPQIITKYALSDEQALLAKVRYNRLLDVFLGIATYSLQNHLRTTVKGIGQIEIDEIYVGVDHLGRQYIMPVQAKGGADQLSIVQARQDMLCCAKKYPSLICRSISAQFMKDDLIALFELGNEGDEIKIVDERHYLLVPAEEISKEDLERYSSSPYR